MGLDIESGFEEDNLPPREQSLARRLFQWFRDKLQAHPLLGRVLFWAVMSLAISLILLLVMLAAGPLSTKIMLYLGEKLGRWATWTWVESHPAAVSLVVCQVYVSVFVLVATIFTTTTSMVDLLRFCRPPPSLQTLLAKDEAEFGESLENIYAHERIAIEPDDAILATEINPVSPPVDNAPPKRVRFFAGNSAVPIYAAESPIILPKYR